MVSKIVNATYTEVYDLKTVTGKMSILGIHTPTADALKKMFHGFFEQYKKVKVNGCNIVGVCASNQSLTPSEVGIEAGKTDPRDVLNPILFKACTGENLNILLDRIYGSLGSDDGSIHRVDNSDTAGYFLDAYYTMLADDSFRKFHPQGGIRVGNLKPFVHRVATTQPFKWEPAGGTPVAGSSDRPLTGIPGNPPEGPGGMYGFGGSNGAVAGTPSVFISNGLESMPWIETTYESTLQDISDNNPGSFIATVLAANIPKIYCGVIVLPPSILQSLYFRFQISWSISFKDFRPAYEIGGIGQNTIEENLGMSSSGLYFNLYNTDSRLTDKYGSFDCDNVEAADTVMEKVF